MKGDSAMFTRNDFTKGALVSVRQWDGSFKEFKVRLVAAYGVGMKPTGKRQRYATVMRYDEMTTDNIRITEAH
jgi:hypothetical protein